MEQQGKKIANQFLQVQEENYLKSTINEKKISDHQQEYEEFRKKIKQQNLSDIFQRYANKYYFNFINQIPVSVFSKQVILRHYKELQQNGIKIKQKFSELMKIQINQTSQHGQIMQISVIFGYFQFNLNVLNLVQENQKFTQPTISIGKGSHGHIYSYFYNKKKYAIKKIKIIYSIYKNEKIIYQTKGPLFQYCIYKLLSVLKLGLKLSQDAFGFDLLCFQDVICFAMQIGIQQKFQSSQKRANISNRFSQLQQTLLFLHDFHILHSDIKPQNILYSTEHDRYVLIDFGISNFVKQSQGQLSLCRFKGTFQFCNDQMKRLLLNQQPDWIDRYWNDVCSLTVSITILNKLKQFENHKNISQNQQNQKNCQQFFYIRQWNDETIFRNFFLQSKMIFLIYQENQKFMEEFIQNEKQKIDIIHILPIFIELHPTVTLFKMYKILLTNKIKIKDFNFFNQIKKQIEQIYESHALKTVVKYSFEKGKLFKKRYMQKDFINSQSQQFTIRKNLQKNINQFSQQNKNLCYFQFVRWLERLNFFLINEKVIIKQTIFQIIRILGRKLFGVQSDLLKIDILLLNCLIKIKQDIQTQIVTFFQEKRSNLEVSQKQKIVYQLNTEILFKLSTVCYRINEIQLSKYLHLCYLKYTFNISKFFYFIFQILKMEFLTLNTNSPMIYMGYFQAIYPNNTDIVLLKKFNQVKGYLPFFPQKQQYSIPTKILIQLKQKVALFWKKASSREKNLFEIYLETIRIIFIPLKISFSQFQAMATQKIRLFDNNINQLIQRLQSKQIEIQEFYRRKLIIDLNHQYANIGFYLTFQKRIKKYYKLLEKKNQKFIHDMMNQQLLISLSKCLIVAKFNSNQIETIVKNVREQNIFGKIMKLDDICIQFKAFTLKKKTQTYYQGQNLLINLLQKTIKRGFQENKMGYQAAFTIDQIFHYYNDINSYELKQKYYWKIKQCLIKYQQNKKKYCKNIIQLLNLLPIQTFLKQNFNKQPESVLKQAEQLVGFKQYYDLFWMLKAKYFGLKEGNKKIIQVYRQYYQYSNDFYSYNCIKKYIEAIQIELQNNQKNMNFYNQNQIKDQEKNYHKQILQVINNFEKKGKQNFFLIPSSVHFHCFLLSVFFKTESYSMIINYFVKFSQFIKQLTQVHNKYHITFYKKLVTEFINSFFFRQKDKEFSHLALQIFMNSQVEQISKYFPEILYFYSALLAGNRKYRITKIQYKIMLKILKLIQYTSKTTQNDIQQLFYALMSEITQQWELQNKSKERIKAARKFYFLKCIRHTQFSQFYNFDMKYINKKQSIFRKSLLKKIKVIKRIWK